MRNRILVVLIALTSLATSAQNDINNGKNDNQEVLRIEKLLREDPNAVTTKDLQMFLADTYKGTDSYGGESTKADVIASRSQIAQRATVLSGRLSTSLPLARSALRNLEVAPRGRDLIVTGTYVIQTEEKPAFDFKDEFRLESHVWRVLKSDESRHVSDPTVK